MPIVRQANNTGEDVSESYPLPVSDSSVVTATKNRDEVLLAAYRLTLGVTATLPTLASVTLPATLTSVMIVPESAASDVRMNHAGAATATTAKVPAAGAHIPITKTIADTTQLFFNGTAYATLMTFGPRN